MTYKDIVDAREKGEKIQAGKSNSKSARSKRKSPQSPLSLRKHLLAQEEETANREIAQASLSEFCSVLRFE